MMQQQDMKPLAGNSNLLPPPSPVAPGMISPAMQQQPMQQQPMQQQQQMMHGQPQVQQVQRRGPVETEQERQWKQLQALRQQQQQQQQQQQLVHGQQQPQISGGAISMNPNDPSNYAQQQQIQPPPSPVTMNATGGPFAAPIQVSRVRPPGPVTAVSPAGATNVPPSLDPQMTTGSAPTPVLQAGVRVGQPTGVPLVQQQQNDMMATGGSVTGDQFAADPSRPQLRDLLQRQQQMQQQQPFNQMKNEVKREDGTIVEPASPSFAMQQQRAQFRYPLPPGQQQMQTAVPSGVLPAQQQQMMAMQQQQQGGPQPRLLMQQQQRPVMMRMVGPGDQFRQPIQPLNPQQQQQQQMFASGQQQQDPRMRMMMMQQQRMPVHHQQHPVTGAPMAVQQQQHFQQGPRMMQQQQQPILVQQQHHVQQQQPPPQPCAAAVAAVAEASAGPVATVPSAADVDDFADLGGLGLDDDELIGLGNDFDILEYADPELHDAMNASGASGATTPGGSAQIKMEQQQQQVKAEEMAAAGSCSSPTSDLSHLLEYAAAAAAAVDPASDLAHSIVSDSSKSATNSLSTDDQSLDAEAVARKKEAEEKAARVAQDVSEFQAKLLEFTITQNSKAAASASSTDSSATSAVPAPAANAGGALPAQPPPPYRGPPPPYPGTPGHAGPSAGPPPSPLISQQQVWLLI